MDARIDPITADYAGRRAEPLENAVYLRLMTPLGSWFADPALGSRLHELSREKDLARVRVLARQYAEQALEPLIADGRAEAIKVTAASVRPGWCLLHINVSDRSGHVRHFEHPVRVA